MQFSYSSIQGLSVAVCQVEQLGYES